jgi:serine/threonine-protein kinase RsbW
MPTNRHAPRKNEDRPALEIPESSSPAHFEVTLPAEIKAISPVVSWVLQLVKDMNFASGKEFEIEMALREALANAITHGCSGDPTQKIDFSITEEPGRGILIVIRDPGRGFDPKSVPSPTDSKNLFSEHGRGIFLINHLMDEVKYERNGAEIHMRKFR